MHLPAATAITSLWAALLPYDGDTKRKVLEDREDTYHFYDTYHAPWRAVKVPEGNQMISVDFEASSSPYIIAASLRGPTFPPQAAVRKSAGPRQHSHFFFLSDLAPLCMQRQMQTRQKQPLHVYAARRARELGGRCS